MSDFAFMGFVQATCQTLHFLGLCRQRVRLCIFGALCRHCGKHCILGVSAENVSDFAFWGFLQKTCQTLHFGGFCRQCVRLCILGGLCRQRVRLCSPWAAALVPHSDDRRVPHCGCDRCQVCWEYGLHQQETPVEPLLFGQVGSAATCHERKCHGWFICLN